jgi:hypothetical protein
MSRSSKLFLGGCLLLACDGANFTPASTVDTLRVLAVQADKPFAEPGELVHLRALVADPLGNGRPVAVAWGTCVNPGSAEIPDCAAAISSFQTSGSDFDVTVPANALDQAPPSLPLGSVGVVFAACAGTITPTRHGLAPVTCTDANGKVNDRNTFMWGEKRITVVRGLRNANPTIVRLRVDGVIWPENEEKTLKACDATSVNDCALAGQHGLQLDITKDSVEAYFGQTEDVVTFFFTSQGELRDDFARPDADGATLTVLALDKPNRTRSEELWFVVRDDRGGMSFTSRRARIE